MTATAEVTVVGGGLAGLVAAVECAEAGLPVTLYEARSRLGGRAASTPPPWTTNLGPHAVYTGGSLWDWLGARDLQHDFVRGAMHGFHMRWKGRRRRTPPATLLRAWPLLRHD